MALEGFSQERYVDEIFSDVTVTDSVVYGTNYSILPAFLGLTTDTIPVPLFMDVYEPAGDTVSARPVIMFAIGGTFFPAIVNGGFTGERKDPAIVDFATAMAKKGYVVSVVQYRRGWNPFGSAIVQQRTILHAAYRSFQDMRNAIRYFRKTEAEDSNPFRINPDKIAVGGTGTGGYVSYGASFFKRFDQTLQEKFIDFSGPTAVPYLDTLIFGDPYGIKPGTINIPNHETYSSDFNMGFALGGALGDSAWVEAGDVPFVALHCKRDPGAPYDIGDVIATDGTTNPPSFFAVIPEGSGGLANLRRSTRLGNQAIFEGITWGDTLFDIAASKSGGIPGLYPFDTPYTPGDAMCEGTGVPGDTLQEWGGPWNYYNEAIAEATWNAVFKDQIEAMPPTAPTGEVAVCVAGRGNPRDAAVSMAYMDTIINYLTPHLAIALELGTTVGINKVIADANVEVYPNPAKDFLRIQYRDGIKMLEGIRVLDMAGRTVRNYTQINAANFEIQRNDMSPGLYILQVTLPDGIVNKKVLIE